MKMIKRLISLGISAACLITAASACSEKITSLDEVSNLTYQDGILSFDSVENAAGYRITILHNGEEVYTDEIEDTAVNLESLGFAGNLTAEIAAYSGNIVSQTSSVSFTILSTFDDVLLEAENYLSNFGTGKTTANFRNNDLAHGGAYVGGIDDIGQGVYINYLCPIAGTYEFVVYYCREDEDARSDVLVNGEYQTEFIYTENTGWGSTTNFDCVPTSTTITLQKGWNTISVMKNGDETNNYGAYAELDYFIIKGSGEQYNVDDLLEYGDSPEYYRLEAEMGSPRKKNVDTSVYECSNTAIASDGDNVYSNGFMIGNIENNYEGLEWQFNSPVKATYKVTIAYSSTETEDSKLASPSFIVTQAEVGMSKNKDFINKYSSVTMSGLPYTGGKIVIAEQTVEITLEAGKNFIYCLLLDDADSGAFGIDYIDIELVEELS